MRIFTFVSSKPALEKIKHPSIVLSSSVEINPIEYHLYQTIKNYIPYTYVPLPFYPHLKMEIKTSNRQTS